MVFVVVFWNGLSVQVEFIEELIVFFFEGVLVCRFFLHQLPHVLEVCLKSSLALSDLRLGSGIFS